MERDRRAGLKNHQLMPKTALAKARTGPLHILITGFSLACSIASTAWAHSRVLELYPKKIARALSGVFRPNFAKSAKKRSQSTVSLRRE
jgi:hypothetical protein